MRFELVVESGPYQPGAQAAELSVSLPGCWEANFQAKGARVHVLLSGDASMQHAYRTPGPMPPPPGMPAQQSEGSHAPDDSVIDMTSRYQAPAPQSKWPCFQARAMGHSSSWILDTGALADIRSCMVHVARLHGRMVLYARAQPHMCNMTMLYGRADDIICRRRALDGKMSLPALSCVSGRA